MLSLEVFAVTNLHTTRGLSFHNANSMMGLRMRLGKPILALLVFSLLFTTSAAAEWLQADLERAIVVVSNGKWLFKSTSGADRKLEFYVDPNDVARMPGNIVFLVVEVGSVDSYAEITPRIRVCVQPLGRGSPVWCSDWVPVQPNSRVEIPVPKRYLLGYYEQASRLYVEIPWWWRLPRNGDTSYGVEVERVLLAPSTAYATTSTTTATPMSYTHQPPADRLLDNYHLYNANTVLILLAIGLLALALVIAIRR